MARVALGASYWLYTFVLLPLLTGDWGWDSLLWQARLPLSLSLRGISKETGMHSWLARERQVLMLWDFESKGYRPSYSWNLWLSLFLEYRLLTTRLTQLVTVDCLFSFIWLVTYNSISFSFFPILYSLAFSGRRLASDSKGVPPLHTYRGRNILVFRMNMLLRRESLIAGRHRDHKEMGMGHSSPTDSGEWVERDREGSGIQEV